MFGQTHEIALKNPDFCRVAEAYGIRAERVTSLQRLQQRCRSGWMLPAPRCWNGAPQLKAPWETGAIPRPAGIVPKAHNSFKISRRSDRLCRTNKPQRP